MKLETLKKIVNEKAGVNIDSKRRNRHIMYSKKIFIKLAYDISVKNTFQKIADELGLTHATCIKHYNTVDEVYDKYKILHNEIIKENKFNVSLFEVNENTQEIKVEQSNIKNKAIRNDFNALYELNDSDVSEFIETRLKPFIRMKKVKHVLK